MLIEAINQPIRYRFRDGREVVFRPGEPVDVPEGDAQRILGRAPGKIRTAQPREDGHIPHGGGESPAETKQACDSHADAVIEPAVRPDGSPLSPVYWQRATGEIAGPGQPEFFAKIGRGATDRDFWIIATHNGDPTWIRADMLRSKQQWATQKPVVSVDGFAPRA